jgi:predicted NBD/HSP70 family sugar kinase
VSWVGIDLGGTKIYAVVFDEGKVLAEAKAKTPTQGGPLAVVDAMAAVVRDLGPVAGLTGVGVGATVRSGRRRTFPAGWSPSTSLTRFLPHSMVCRWPSTTM